MISLKISLSMLSSSFNGLNLEAFLIAFPILIGAGFKSLFLGFNDGVLRILYFLLIFSLISSQPENFLTACSLISYIFSL